MIFPFANPLATIDLKKLCDYTGMYDCFMNCDSFNDYFIGYFDSRAVQVRFRT